MCAPRSARRIPGAEAAASAADASCSASCKRARGHPCCGGASLAWLVGALAFAAALFDALPGLAKGGALPHHAWEGPPRPDEERAYRMWINSLGLGPQLSLSLIHI